MTNAKDHIEMALKAAEGFANDGKLDANELNEIIDIAERDGVIGHDEVRVLRNTIARIFPHEVDDELRNKLAELSAKLKNLI